MPALTHEQAVQRAALIEESCRRNPGRASQGALASAVAAAVGAAVKERKAARRVAKRAAQEAAAARVLRERQQLAAQFTEVAVGRALREASGGDLAAIAATALSGTGQPGPAGRPVAEVTVDPRTLSLEDLGFAAAVGTAGNSPFWGGSPAAGKSPFWRDLQVSGASKGTADA